MTIRRRRITSLCPSCRGERWHHVPALDRRGRRIPEVCETKHCPTCQGWGYLSRVLDVIEEHCPDD